MSDFNIITNPEEQKKAPQPGSPVSAPPGISLSEPPVAKSAPGGLTLLDSYNPEKEERAKQVVTSYLAAQDDPHSAQAQLDVSNFLADSIGMSPSYINENYSDIITKITGSYLEPPKAWQKIKDGFVGTRLDIKQNYLYGNIVDNPDSPDRQLWEQQITDLETERPPENQFDYPFVVDIASATAKMAPYTWELMYPQLGASAVAGGVMLASKFVPGLNVLSWLATAGTTASKVTRATKIATAVGRGLSFANGYDMAKGSLFQDMRMMEDSEGNKLPEEYAISSARLWALPITAVEAIQQNLLLKSAGVFSGALKNLESKTVTGIIEKALSTSLTKWGVKGGVHQMAMMLFGGGSTVVEENVEEISQFYLEWLAEDFAVNLYESASGEEFDIDLSEGKREELIETIKETTLASLGFGMAGGVKTAYNHIKDKSVERFKNKEGESTETIADTVAGMNEEDADYIIGTMANEQKAMNAEKVKVEVGETSASAVDEKGESVGSVDYEVNEESIVIKNVTVSEVAGTQILAELQDKFPGKDIVWESSEEKMDMLRKITENQTPELKGFNEKIEGKQSDIKEAQYHQELLQNKIKELQDAKGGEGVVEEIAQMEEELQRVTEEIAVLSEDIGAYEQAKETFQMPAKSKFKMTVEEYAEKVGNKVKKQSTFSASPEGVEFKSKIKKAFPGFTTGQIHSAVALVELRANAIGMTPQQWLDTYVAPEVFSDKQTAQKKLAQGNKAGVEFLESGKALFHVTKKSDFSSWVHELGHVFEAQLSEKEREVARKWSKVEARKMLQHNLSVVQEMKRTLSKVPIPTDKKLKTKLANEKKNVAKQEKQIADELGELSTTQGWTIAMREAFAEGFERYTWEGKVADKGMRKIFRKFAEFMKQVYDTIANKPELTPEIRSVFENMLAPERLDAIDAGTTFDYDVEHGADDFLHQSGSVWKYAKANGFLDDWGVELTERLQAITAIDTRLYNHIRGKASNAVIKQKNYYEINRALKEDPTLVRDIRAHEEFFGVTVLDENDQLYITPAEGREKYRPVDKGKSRAEGKTYASFFNFSRNIGQEFLDRMPDVDFERYRQQMIKTAEYAFENKDLLTERQFTQLFERSYKNDDLNTKLSTQRAIRKAHKTMASLNLNSQCPMFNIGSHGCYLDGCYVTSMGGGGSSAVNYYAKAMYGGEILQLSKEAINELNDVGGLRINGMGDLDYTQEAQFRDVIRHAGMVGLKLKTITKQEATLKMIHKFQQSEDKFLSDKAKEMVVQTTVDPYFIEASADNKRLSMAEPYFARMEALKAEGDHVTAQSIYEELQRQYEEAGYQTMWKDGKLYRKYGFSSGQIAGMAKKYPGVKVQIRTVVSTPMEIAETALHGPKILQTWMHATIDGDVYSTVHEDILKKGTTGNYTSRITITKVDGEWKIFAGDGNNAGEPRNVEKAYTAVEEYIKGNYNPEQQEKIFNTLSGQLGEDPGALCCGTNASSDACNGCASHCQSGSFLKGESLEIVAKHSGRMKLFQPAPPVNSENFKRWFGDSKVVDESGQPLVVYHGTNSNLEQFDMSRTGEHSRSSLSHGGFFFSDDKATANGYGKNVHAVYLSLENLYVVDKKNNLVEEVRKGKREGYDGAVIRQINDNYYSREHVHINGNPLYTLDSNNEIFSLISNEASEGEVISVLGGAIEYWENEDTTNEYAEDLQDLKELKEAVESGANVTVGRLGNESDVYVAFSPTQIKSVNNTGAWSQTDPRIMYQPEVDKNSDTTQIPNTRGSYRKTIAHLLKVNPDIKTVLDYGAGLGLGSEEMREAGVPVDSFEPNIDRWESETPPTYTEADAINKKYDAIVSLNVLNVLKKDMRDFVVADIYSKLKPGGVAFIGARGWKYDVADTKNFREGEEERSVYVKKKRNGEEVEVYQKGFEGTELVDYLESQLGVPVKSSAMSTKKGAIFTKGTETLFQPAWHGTPHDVDQFSTEYMGTGEGAQVFGWGLYFTSEEDIARWYANSITSKLGQREKFAIGSEKSIHLHKDFSQPAYKAMIEVSNASSKEQRLDIVNEAISGISDSYNSLKKFNERGIYDDKDFEEYGSVMQEGLSALNEMKDALESGEEYLRIIAEEPKKRLYKVDLRDDMNWLQYAEDITPEIKEAVGKQLNRDYVRIVEEAIADSKTLIEKLGLEYDAEAEVDATETLTREDIDDFIEAMESEAWTIKGGELYDLLKRLFIGTGTAKKVSMLLKRAGIDGISYPAGSLGAGTGKGTNYVVFDGGDVQVENRIQFQPAPDTNTPEFYNWFKQSEILNPDGSPKVVYHGTGAKFESFNKSLDDRGNDLMFFAEDMSVARYFMNRSTDIGQRGNMVEAYLSIQKLFTGENAEELRGFIEENKDLLLMNLSTRSNEIIDEIKAKMADGKSFTDAYMYELQSEDWRAYEYTPLLVSEIKRMGFDGLRVWEDGTNYAIFNPNQVKSVENNGEYSTEDDRIMYQPEHEEAVKEAVESGKNVPDKVLRQYAHMPWAGEELERRAQRDAKLKDFPDITNVARSAKDKESFLKRVGLMMPDIDEDKPTESWLTEMWEAVHEGDEVLDINTANDNWLARWDEDKNIQELLIALNNNPQQAESLGFTEGLISTARRYGAPDAPLTANAKELVRATFRNNTTQNRDRVSQLLKDASETTLLSRQRDFSERVGIVDQTEPTDVTMATRLAVASKIEDPALKAKALDGTLTNGEVNSRYSETSAKEKELEQKVASTELALKNALQDAKKEAKHQTAEGKKAYKEALTSARQEAKLAMKAYKEAQKEKAQAKKLKEYMKRLAKMITRKVSPSTVDFEYRMMIQAIQSAVDPNFRSKKTLYRMKRTREFFEKNPEAKMLLNKKLLARMEQTSLNDYTVEELEEMKDQIVHLLQVGRLKKRLKDKAEATIVKNIASEMGKNMMKGRDMPPPEPKHGDPRTGKDKAISVLLQTYRPSRIADWIDGGKDFKGVTVREFILAVDKAYNAELTSRMSREQKAETKLAELELTPKSFARQINIDGEIYVADEIMDIYAGLQNELKAKAIRFGNNMDEAYADRLIAELTDKEKEFADWIVDEYEENYERLADAFVKYTNNDIGHEHRYTPILRMSWQYEVHENQIADQMLLLNSIQNKGIEKGFGKARVNIGEKHQRQIQLGLYTTWADQIAKQEHYINSAGVVSRLNKVLKHDDVRQASVVAGKASHIDEMQKYVDRVTNPNVYKSQRGLNLMVKTIRNNSAMAFLAYNPVTMLKQLPSLAFYMAYSSPGAMMGAIGQTISSWKETRGFIEEKDKQMRDRSIERSIEELKQNKAKDYDKIIKKVGLVGMKGIMFFDKMATTVGWKAVYDASISKGMSENEAVEMARRATLESQPASGAKDVASLYAEDNFLTIFLQFTNQLNQIWNMVTYDAPQALKNGNYYKGITTYMGVMFSAGILWMISNRRLPDKPEDYLEMVSDQFMNIVPIIGPVISRSADGWNTSVTVLSPFESTGKAVGRVKRAMQAKELTNDDIEVILKNLYEGIGVSTGLPTVVTNRAIKAIESDVPLQMFLLGGKINDTE